MRLWKMSVNQSENVCNICGYCFGEWLVKTNNNSSAIFWFLSLIFGVFKINFEPTCRAFSYSRFAVLNISSLDDFFDSLRWMEFGTCFMTFGGWFDKLMNVKKSIVWLFVRTISSISQIK